MAYADRMPGRNRTLAMATVAGLHGIALYGLITGLGVKYVEQVIPTFTGRNIPIEPAPPPKEPPQATPSAHETTRVTAPQPRLAIPNSHSEPVAPPEILDIPLIPLGPIADPVDFARPQPSRGVAPKAAHPRNDPAAWVSTEDYPATALRRGEQGSVRFELAVGTDGRVAGCRVTGSSGSAELDAATCRQVMRRARFEPATGEAGEKISGTYKGTIRWVIPD